METSPSLAIESFSHSWLANAKPSLDSFDEPLTASVDSSHEHTSKAHNFNFDIQLCIDLVDADELFFNGLIKPVYVEPPKRGPSCSNSDSTSVMLDSSSSSIKTVVIQAPTRGHILRRWRKASDQVLQKCCQYVRSFFFKVGCSRKCIRVDDIDRRVWEARSLSNSPQASPLPTIACSVGDWCDTESSIYEAVLHCKRSIGN
ncbi:hypothetical protein CFOL_v3_13403 [Cephalotus follicularis]|uniref:Membrane-associated kinase regulator 6 n=1 Tax=Cephalotus follicularis TaxID=3775 RepID=A0A1Q3BQD0_CEPFO|nr:hypothetical protein CFOL_v3_13403 [Cephalotus follicularis]